MDRVRVRAVLAAFLGVAAGWPTPVPGATEGGITTTFAESWAANDGGRRVTAVGLRAPASPAPERAAVLVLVDTSASQAGPARIGSLEALAVVLKALRPDDAVALAAVDVSCVPLTPTFHAPKIGRAHV